MGDSFENILFSAKEETKISLRSKEKTKEAVGEWTKIVGGPIHYTQKPVEKWGTKDLFYFFLNKFKETTGEDFVIAVIPGQQNILLLQDAFAKEKGSRPTQAETKEYIEWFLDNIATGLMSRYNCFKMKFMYAQYNIERFIKQQKGFVQSKVTESKIGPIFSEGMMESVYLISHENFVLKYGLVLSVIWLMRMKGQNEQEAILSVINLAESLCKKDKYDALVVATEQHNPYPIWCKFVGMKKMLVDLADRTDELFDILDIRFSKETTNFGFLDK